MKNNMIRTLILILGVTCCVPCRAVNAEVKEERADAATGVSADGRLGFPANDEEKIIQENLDFESFSPKSQENKVTLLENGGLGKEEAEEDSGRSSATGEEISGSEPVADMEKVDENQRQFAETENTEVRHLRIPQKLEVVIDPWEMDGKGQIYSEPYVIRNEGEAPGILTLSSLACIPQKKSGVIVRTDPVGLHDDQEKSVYMQMLFGSGEHLILSEEGSGYEAELQPGEELSVCFVGEVNEGASKEWQNGDVTVSIVYSWEEQEIAEAPDMETETDEDIDTSMENGETVDGEEGIKLDEPENEEERDRLTDEEDEPKLIELQDSIASEFTADSWKKDDDGRICSGQYTVRNTGESAGTFTLSEILSKQEEESGIAVSSEEEAIYIELVTETGETFILSQESDQVGQDEYKVKLQPGEEATFWFTGKLDGILSVTAEYLWTAQEGLDE